MKSYTPVNDETCGWIHTAQEAALPYPQLQKNVDADWLIIGAGYTGVAAAFRLAQLQPDANIVLIDAEQAGAGASARNSGYIVDVTLNDGGASLADDKTQIIKSKLNMLGLDLLRQRVQQLEIECNWHESGKFHCAADSSNLSKLHRFERFLRRNGIDYAAWNKAELSERLGTDFYQYAVQTKQSVLVNPAELIIGLLKNLPENIQVYAHSPALNIQTGKTNHVQTPKAIIRAKNMIVTVNALMPRLGFKRNYVFPLTLTASLTRPLSDQEYRAINSPKPWGVLSASSMGATVRLTNDRRIMVRNTVEKIPALTMGIATLAKRKACNELGLRKRFPELKQLDIEYSWSGNVCISRNSKPVFEKLNNSVFLAGCYNAGGIAMGSLFGKLIVDYAFSKESEALSHVLNQEKPSALPPRPLFDLGLRARLRWQRFRGRHEA